MNTVDTKSMLLAEAETLMRTQGYAAFSYADLADRVGIRKASIHHHFPTKESLGTALIDNYLERFIADLEQLAERPISTKNKLLAYGEFFVIGLREGLMPLCGALAADAVELPASMQQRVKKFFKIHLDWLETILNEGIAERTIKPKVSARRSALFILSTLQGASLVAWAMKDPAVIRPVLRQAVDSLEK
jgi:TetR/AcrR family transcriptional regulator, transcriptional repressor for nem operon